MLAIGFYANIRNKNISDYILGGRDLSGPIVALGVGASDMSSWLLMALPGAVLVHGLNQIWLPIGLCLGAYCNWRFVADRLRTYSEKANNALTLPAYFAGRFPDKALLLRAITAVIVLVFFSFYTSAGFVAGAFLLKMIFHVHYQIGLLISAGVIVIYTTVGGFFAISWIDFFQGCLMFLSLLIVPTFTFHHLHSWEPALLPIWHQAMGYFNPFHDFSIVAMLSLLAWGLGYFGQPHILVRFMSVRSTRELPLARYICMLWMSIALFGAVVTGVVGHAFFTGTQVLDNPENVFIRLAYLLFNPWVAGILISAVLSAIMSTSSAQLLASASALIEDLYHPFINKKATPRQMMVGARLAVIIVSVCSYALGMHPDGTILKLVSYAWAGLGAAFGPVIIFSLYWKRMTSNSAMYGMAVGAIVVIAWELLGHYFHGVFDLYSLIPGFFANTLVIVLLTHRENARKTVAI